MTIHKFALGGAAVFALVTLAAPAFAFTHHPATPAENAQTDELNAQALANAQGGTAPAGATNAGANSNTLNNGGMITGSGMNAGGIDENGNAAPPPKPTQPTPDKPSDDSTPNNGQ
ncbi:MAG: hypothetical protein WDN01_15675 [Rhizomicrobium sp.]